MSITIFEQNILHIYKAKGTSWLAALPATTQKLASIWNLTDLVVAPNLSYNYVLFGKQNELPIVLKIGCDQAEMKKEMQALQAYNGNGCIRLLAVNLDHNALLIEQAHPGTTLKSLFPAQEMLAVQHAATVMRKLHAVAVANLEEFPTIADWLKILHNKKYEPLFGNHLKKARELAEQLLKTQTQPVLLHGDLHHENILSMGDGWIAIDPKGVVGESAYEVGAFIRNPFPELLQQKNAAAIMQQRLELFSQLLRIEYQRLLTWSYVQAVLAACWAIDDGQPDPLMALAEAKILAGL